MEVIKNLLIKLRHTGVLFLIGIIVITYIAFGFIYWQQERQQGELEENIARLNLILAKPLLSAEKLQAEYEEVNLALAPMTDVDTIAMLVRIAEENGIDVDMASAKFSVPTAAASRTNMRRGTYQVLAFNDIHIQGDYDNVMAFISDLDSGKKPKNVEVESTGEMVLTRVTTGEVPIVFTGEEGARRAEFRSMTSAVKNMMTNNSLTRIPNPINFAGGVAANFTGDDPNTEETVEGFPDITTTAAEKGYSGNATVSAGYVLYEHDNISTDNTTQFKTISYITTLTTKYYYTCEADGTVRQFDGANVSTATEYVTSEPSRIETVVNVNVAVYFKP